MSEKKNTRGDKNIDGTATESQGITDFTAFGLLRAPHQKREMIPQRVSHFNSAFRGQVL